MDEKNLKQKSSKKKSNQLEELEQKVRELEDHLKRAVADYRNFEKRMEEEKKETIKYANRELLLRLIPAFDTLFLAEKFIKDEDLKVTIKHIGNVLSDVGVERVETVGKIFDPNFMEAVATEEGEDHKVIDEIRPGFMLYGRLLRPAQVKVGKKV